jgi:hypothetical protein
MRVTTRTTRRKKRGEDVGGFALSDFCDANDDLSRATEAKKRPADESKEEKKARKAAVKEEKQVRNFTFSRWLFDRDVISRHEGRRRKLLKKRLQTRGRCRKRGWVPVRRWL